ncbi:MAG: rod shape-determining protein MreC [Actinomycetota bacterium]
MAVRSKPRSTRLLVVVLISACLAVITVDYRQGEDGPLSGLGRLAIDVMAPLQEGVRDATRPVGDFVAGIASAGSIKAERDALEAELEQAHADLASAASQQLVLEEIQGQQELVDRLKPEALPAQVLSYAPNNFEWTMTIDVGTSDGVREGMPAIASAGLVGTISRAGSDSSIVRLIIDQDSFVTSRVMTGQDVQPSGLLQGQGDAPMRLDLIPVESQFDVVSEASGPLVQTGTYRIVDEQGLYPPGIPIGTVERVFRDTARDEMFVTVRPAVDFATVEFVQVLLTEQDGG